jgi:exopolysaccharide production protein ExoZ
MVGLSNHSSRSAYANRPSTSSGRAVLIYVSHLASLNKYIKFSLIKYMSIVARNKTFDMLRGMAILGVICVHTSQTFPTNDKHIDYALGFGRFGVQLFYFISALTMCYMWDLRKMEANQVVKFYIRRFLRIAPLFWIAMAAYLFMRGGGSSFGMPDGVKPHQLILTATFLHGFWPDSINFVVPGGWSIAVEMTFYLIFPWLVISIKNHYHFLYLAIAIYFFNLFIINSLIINLTSMLLVSNERLIRDFIYLNFFNQVPVFLMGCFLYCLINSSDKLDFRKIVGVLFLWISTAIIANIYFNPPVQNINFLLVVVCEFLLIFIVLRLQLMFTPLEKLGKNSYAIYLSHFAVINLAAVIFGINDCDRGGVMSFTSAMILVTLISYFISVMSYQILEKRLHNLAAKLTS